MLRSWYKSVNFDIWQGPEQRTESIKAVFAKFDTDGVLTTYFALRHFAGACGRESLLDL